MKQMNLNRGTSGESQSTVLTLYHGSPCEEIRLVPDGGKSINDYGRGLYLTPDLELAKEWAVGPRRVDGWVHTYRLDTRGLRSYNFDLPVDKLPSGEDPFPSIRKMYNVLVWLGTLLSHRGLDKQGAYWSRNGRDFAARFGLDCEAYDIPQGWRADDSFFQIAEVFASNLLDIMWLPELLRMGELGIQYCVKSAQGFQQMEEISSPIPVVFEEYGPKYDTRDKRFRICVRDFLDQKQDAGFRAKITVTSLL